MKRFSKELIIGAILIVLMTIIAEKIEQKQKAKEKIIKLMLNKSYYLHE